MPINIATKYLNGDMHSIMWLGFNLFNLLYCFNLVFLKYTTYVMIFYLSSQPSSVLQLS